MNSSPAASPARYLQFFMKFLLILYSLFLIVFSLFITFLLFSSSHHIDTDFLIIHLSSILIFLLTIYYLNKTVNGNAKYKNPNVLTLVFTGIVFIYYSQDIFKDIKSISDLNWFTFLPLLGLGLTLYFIFIVIKKNKVQSRN